MQYGFVFDQGRCSGCRTCSVACKNWHNLPPGPLRYLRVYEYEKGKFPAVRLHYQWIPCYHCEKPVCIGACPSQALYKEPVYGAVLLNSDECDGCRACYDACPYGAIVFESDEPGATAQKCDMCIDRLEAGKFPICVSSCVTRALDFGPIDELIGKYGNKRDLEDLPDSTTTGPSVVFIAHAPKRQLVKYDAERALKLLARRDPLPPLFDNISDVTDIPAGIVGRSKLVIKHKSVEELMECTRNDEG